MLVVETPVGILRQNVPSASPLRSDIEQGDAAEVATHDAAGVWGVPDFVYRAAKRTLGSGVRELGDGIIAVGRRAIVLQVKSRREMTADPAKEQRWVQKNVTKAINQANGTVRQLNLQPGEFTNRRNRTLMFDGAEHDWVECVVIDHPGVPFDTVPELVNAKHPAVVLLRRDWEFLFRQLKSAHAVCVYLHRVADSPVPLGEEPARYYALANADAKATPDPIDRALAGFHRQTVTAPLLPLHPVPDSEPEYLVFKSILEDIGAAAVNAGDERDRVRVLAELDTTQGTHRGSIGRFLLEELAATTAVPDDETQWRMRSFRGGREMVHLGFCVASKFSEMHRDIWRTWVELRHHEMRTLTGADLTTVGVLLTIRHDGVRPWDTTMTAVSGDIPFADGELEQLQEFWSTSSEKTLDG